MMLEIKWVKLAVNWYKDEDIQLIRAMPDGDTIALLFIMLLALAGDRNQDGILPYSDEELAVLLSIPLPTVRLGIEVMKQKGMLEQCGMLLHITNWAKYQNTDAMDRIREQTRKRVQKHRLKQKEAQALPAAQNALPSGDQPAEPPLFDIDDQTVRDHNDVLNAAEDAGFPTDTATMNRLIDIYAEYGKQITLDGIRACVDSNVKNIRYLLGCCKKAKAENFVRADGVRLDAAGREIWDDIPAATRSQTETENTNDEEYVNDW